MSHRALQTNRAGDLFSPLHVNLLARNKLSLCIEEAAANAQAGNPVIELTLRPPTPVGKEINVDARMSALFDGSHWLSGTEPRAVASGIRTLLMERLRSFPFT